MTPFGGFGRTAAAWLTVTTWPPAVNEPVRAVVVPFFATEYPTAPLPVPPVFVRVSQLVAALAVHVQDGALAVSVTEPVPAADPVVTDVGERLKVHATASPWETAKL